MTIYERGLPGVGKKRKMDLSGGSQLVITTHNSGKRKVFRRTSADGDSEKLFELTGKLAQQVGILLEGTYFQSVQTGTIETLLGGNTLIEWVEVGANSDIASETLGESDLRQTTGVSVITIEQGGEVVTSPDGDATVEAGDMLIVIGPKTACHDFVTLVKGA